MSQDRVRVGVQWALHGKEPGRAGYMVLACSNGELSKQNFAELIDRFSPGTLEKEQLPQVSVSYLSTKAGPVDYLAMAVHREAAEVQTDGDEPLDHDDDDRLVTVTTYFCVPYAGPAELAVSYRDMYEEFSGVQVGMTGGPPLTLDLPARDSLPVPTPLAMQSASRLLSGRPLCVLGASATTVQERLAFIEAVTQLLPYGFRARLTAATWVRATQRDHRFRIFFSGARRDVNPPDEVVHWGNPEMTALTPHDDHSYEYYEWLASRVGQLNRLATMRDPRAFTTNEIEKSLDEVILDEHPGGRHSGERKTAVTQPDGRISTLVTPPPRQPSFTPAYPTPPTILPRPRDTPRDVEQLLRDCAACMREESPNLPGLSKAIEQLKNKVRRIHADDRPGYRAIIKEERLFRREKIHEELDPKSALRETLIKIAFPGPLGYTDYCDIEDGCLAQGGPGTESPDPGLLRMVMDQGMSDHRIKSVVYAPLPLEEKRKTLDKWYKQPDVNAIDLINTAAGGWHRSIHAWHASKIAADYVTRMDGELGELRELRTVLSGHSYLAHVVRTAGEERIKDQIDVLTGFLKAAYPNGLDEPDIRQILTGKVYPPSHALLVAVLLMLKSDERDLARLAREAYVFSTTMAILPKASFEALKERLPFADPESPRDAEDGSHPYPDGATRR
jgi:hypothetical protein